MQNSISSTPRRAAAARANGQHGGTKSPEISRWNSLKHGLTAAKLIIEEGKHLPDYAHYLAISRRLQRELEAFGPLTVDEQIAIDKFAADSWRVKRAFRHELGLTERDGMHSPALPNLMRYSSSAHRQHAQSSARIEQIRERKQMDAKKPANNTGAEEPTASEPPPAEATTQTACTSAVTVDPTPVTKGSPAAQEGELGSLATATPHPTQPGHAPDEVADETVDSADHGETASLAHDSGLPASTTVRENEKKDDKSETLGAG